VTWWVADKETWKEFSAWVATDLASINACGDIDVGRRRYMLMPTVYPGNARVMGQAKAPSLVDFGNGIKFQLIKGDANNITALEPLNALLDIYAQEGEQIVADDAARKARQKAQSEWEKANPEPVRDTEIRFWPVQSKEYSTTPVSNNQAK
jgi:hypothetical protein